MINHSASDVLPSDFDYVRGIAERNYIGRGPLCAELELLLHLAGERDQFGSAMRDELLVGGDDGLVRGENTSDPIFGGFKAAHDFDNDIGVGGENVFDVFGPDDIGRKPVNFFAGNVAIEDVCEAQVGITALDQNFGDGAADCAKTEEGDFAGFGCWAGVPCWQLIWGTRL